MSSLPWTPNGVNSKNAMLQDHGNLIRNFDRMHKYQNV